MWAIFQTIKGSWLKHIVTQLSALFILTATYAVALFIILSTNNIKNIFNIWGKVNEATIYVNNKADVESQKLLEQYLSSHPMIDAYIYENSQQAAEEFNKKFKTMSSQSVDPKNISQFFPATYRVKFNNDQIYKSDRNKLDGFAATVKDKFPFVDDVSYGKLWLSKYEKVISGIESASWFVVFIILMASLFVSSNVIKTVLFSKKDEIEILEFVGAGSAWIYGPHIINICLLSCISFASAVFVNYSVYSFSYSKASTVVSALILNEINFLSPAALLFYFLLIMGGVSCYSMVSIASLLPKNSKKTVYVEGVS